MKIKTFVLILLPLSLLSERKHISCFPPMQKIVNCNIFNLCDGCISPHSCVIFCPLTISTKISLQSCGLFPPWTRVLVTAVPCSEGEVWDDLQGEWGVPSPSHPHPNGHQERVSQPFDCRRINILAENALLGLQPATFLHRKMKIMS